MDGEQGSLHQALATGDCLDQFLAFAFSPMALEGGFGDRDRRPPRGENQMVAFGVAWDAVLLAAQAAEAPAVH